MQPVICLSDLRQFYINEKITERKSLPPQPKVQADVSQHRQGCFSLNSSYY